MGYHELFLVLSTLQDSRNDSYPVPLALFISPLSLHSLGHAGWHPFLSLVAHLFSINRLFFDSRLIILVTLSFLWGLLMMYDHSSTGPVAYFVFVASNENWLAGMSHVWRRSLH